MRATKEVLGWDPDKKFLVPDEVLAHLNGSARPARSRSWKKELARIGRTPPRASFVDAACAGELGPWTLPDVRAGEPIATRSAGRGDAGVQGP